MTTYDFVHLVIHASGDKVQGRTKLQKLVYFVGVLTGYLDRLGYRPHFYGPYSPEVAGAVQELRSLKFLDQQTASTGVVDTNGFEVTRYDYALTEEGKQVASEKAKASPAEWRKIVDAMQKLNASKVTDYVQLAIASKTYFLTHKAGKVLPPNLLKVKTAEHGWNEFTDSQYAETLKFLETVVGLKPTAVPQ